MRDSKLLTRLMIGLTFLLSFSVFAEEEPFVVIETDSRNVRLSDDGTGIVKNVFCAGCEFKIVKVIPSSKATYQGVEVDIREVRNLKDKAVMVSFNPETQEVQFIRW